MSSTRGKPKPELRLDWCSYEAAKYAVEHWHYSGRMPIGRMVRVGVWEAGEYVGCVLFARGSNPSISSVIGLDMVEVCELVRVALREHGTPVTRIVSIALQMLKQKAPGLRAVVSYADPAQGHVGAIYQAGNWCYVGATLPSLEHWHEGRWKHNREVTGGAFGQARKVVDYSRLPKRQKPGKHKYLMPLDREMAKQIEPLRKPYPKRTPDRGTSGSQPEAGGASPTRALQTTTGQE